MLNLQKSISFVHALLILSFFVCLGSFSEAGPQEKRVSKASRPSNPAITVGVSEARWRQVAGIVVQRSRRRIHVYIIVHLNMLHIIDYIYNV